jgi:predicted metal-dependent hydrolase
MSPAAAPPSAVLPRSSAVDAALHDAAPSDVVLLHDLTQLEVGDLLFSIAPASRTSSLEVIVERDASLVLKAPALATADRAREFVVSKRSWIYRRLAEKDALIGPPIAKTFANGEGFAYLGRSYRLTLDDSVTDIRLDRGRFVVPAWFAGCASEGRDAMRRWYIAAGQAWLQRRIAPWASRAGAGDVVIDVRDLGYRWGSARPSEAARINIHWATLQLPPSLIDYVLVHELAHLTEANHTPEYWAIVGRLMPAYESHKQTLASIGKNVWLGEVTGTVGKLS